MDLSIVIPAFEECRKIARDVEAAAAFLQANRLAGEVVVVDDGSCDGTAEAARAVRVPPAVRLNVIHYDQHRGKGCAVRTGMNAAGGKYAMFADCGLCIPYNNALKGLEMLRNGACDIAHGSRRHIASDIHRAQPWHRRSPVTGVQIDRPDASESPPELADTQCGFKMYRGDVARELYRQCTTDGFMFDIEIILRAMKRGYRIARIPRRVDLRPRQPALRRPHALARALGAAKNPTSHVRHNRREM